MTFSLAARCDRTGRFGVVVCSSSPAVAARCAHVRANVGAVCSQNITDPRLGSRLLDTMAAGHTASEAIDRLVEVEPAIEYRQLTAIAAASSGAAYSGSKTLGLHRSSVGDGCVAAGNLLASADVPAGMVAAFEATAGQDLGDRLISALQGGLAAGGESGPVRSAGMLIADGVAWPVADLRVDWHDDPIGELGRLWDVWKPQLDDYVTRALDPSTAPAYGVPGDE